jgi:spermidine/putrescine transport system ATP-binding protein
VPDQIDVQLTNVTKLFGETVAVDNVSFDVRHGEFFSLLGPSGCGKSTTLRMIAGFEFPTSGELRIRDRVVNTVPAFKRETNLIFQQLALFPHLDVFDNIAFGPRIKRLPAQEIRQRVMRVLEIVQLEGYARRAISQLSGGQQQRIAIARALVNEPAVLLLDEPLGALDLKLRLQMQLELKSLQHRLGTTFIYVTHDQGEALTMSDRIAVMNYGRIEQIGPGRDIYLRPTSTFVARFIGETNLLSGTTKAIEGDMASIATEGLDLRVKAVDSLRAGEQVNLSIRPETINVYRVPSPHLHDHNTFTARVTDVTFFGSTIRYQLTLPSGFALDVERLAGDETSFRVGDESVVSVSPTVPVVLRDAAPAPGTT